jgi:hypothetical protein
MATTKRKQKRAPARKRKTGLDAGIQGMEKMMGTTTKMVGAVATAGMEIGLAGAVIGMI